MDLERWRRAREQRGPCDSAGPGSAACWALPAQHREPRAPALRSIPNHQFQSGSLHKHQLCFFTTSSSFPNTGVVTEKVAKQKERPGSSYCTVESKNPGKLSKKLFLLRKKDDVLTRPNICQQRWLILVSHYKKFNHPVYLSYSQIHSKWHLSNSKVFLAIPLQQALATMLPYLSWC